MPSFPMGPLAHEVVHLLPGPVVVPKGSEEDLSVVQAVGKVDKTACQALSVTGRQASGASRRARSCWL